MRRPLLVLALISACAGPVEEPAIDLDADPDGDGVSTGDELAGYEILVDETGLWDPVSGRVNDPRTVRLVTSDPNVADSDADGLSDLEERAHATDARRQDSDGDGLSDLDEIVRWGTSATAVDTDGDADGGRESGSETPLPALFDGAELRLELVDGVLHAGPGATSPTLSDTDGDGASDYYELLSPTRDPVVPERPEFELALTPGTAIALDLNLEWGEEFENSESVETTQFEGRGSSSSTSGQLGGEVYGSLETWLGINVSAEAEISLSTSPFGFSTKSTLYGGLDYTLGASANYSYAMSGGARAESRGALHRVREESKYRTQRVTGGRVAATFDVVNTGDLAFRLTDLALGVTRFDSVDRVVRPLTTLHAATPNVTLGRGERATLFFEDDDVPADRVIEALDDPTSLSFTPVAYGIERAEGVDLDYADEDILLRTARVEVHFADGRRVVHHRASDIGRDELGNPIGLTVRDLLQEAGVDAASEETEREVFVYEIAGIPTEMWPDEPEPWHEPGFDPGDRWLKSGWFVVLDRDTASEEAPRDLLETPVRAGERAVVVQITDLDRDGLSSWQEGQLGTSDDAIDSDGDGPSDPYELGVPILVGYELVDGDDVEVYSFMDPGAEDGDGDGMSDWDEATYDEDFRSWHGPDPRNPDSDGDGWLDGEENDARHLDIWFYDFYSPPELTCVPKLFTYRDGNGVERFCNSVEVVVTDRHRDLAEVRVFETVNRTDTMPEVRIAYDLDLGVAGTWKWSDDMHPTTRSIVESPAVCTRSGTVEVWARDLPTARQYGSGNYFGSVQAVCSFGGTP